MSKAQRAVKNLTHKLSIFFLFAKLWQYWKSDYRFGVKKC